VTAQILDGKATAATIKNELRQRVAKLREAGVVPGLGTVLVGDDPGSVWYVAGKHRDCAQVGISSIRVDLPADAGQAQVEDAVDALNADPGCTGYIVQLPLPRGLDEHAVIARIDPDKDADGLHPTNLGWLVLGKDAPLPCTPRGIVELLRRHGVETRGADVCVIGRGITVGRSLGLLLTRPQRERHGDAVPHRHRRPGRPRTTGRHRGGGRRGAWDRHRRHGQAGCGAAGRGGQPRTRRHPGRRRPGGRGGRRLDLAQPRWRGTDDPRAAAHQRGRGS
jgi:hypothetical protein